MSAQPDQSGAAVSAFYNEDREKTCPCCGGTGCEDCDGSGCVPLRPAFDEEQR